MFCVNICVHCILVPVSFIAVVYYVALANTELKVKLRVIDYIPMSGMTNFFVSRAHKYFVYLFCVTTYNIIITITQFK